MIDRKKLLVICIGLSLLGVLGLFVYSTTIEPVELDIADIEQSYVGSVIVTSGTISYARALSDGSLSIILCDIDSGSDIKVYFPSDAYNEWEGGNLTPGTVIRVRGEVELYQESLEISLSSAEDLEVISEAGELELSLWQILESVDVMEGMEVVTNGTVHEIEVIGGSGQLVGTSFELAVSHENRSYGIECMAFGSDLSPDVADWDLVSVRGRLEYYVNGGCWQLVVSDLVVLVDAV